MKRSSGILLPVSSLPSPYGIGTMGKAAYDFLDFLSEADQTYWQILPVGPTALGDSPYQSPSAHAGNPFLIDPDLLIKDGLLTKKEVTSVKWGDDPCVVDYSILCKERPLLLKKACARLLEKERDAVKAFEAEESSWLPDYALFMALMKHFGDVSWLEWPDEAIRLRKEEAIIRYRELLSEDIDYYVAVQYLFFRQWALLREHAKKAGIRILGDLPLYVALDSADVWASPKDFLLDEKNVPTAVAGVPPDYFSEEGQLWGNPLYDYEEMEREGFGFWIRRIGGAQKLYDAVRIDHFRGLESFWAVPYGETSAKNGHWVKGPGMKLIGVLTNWFRDMVFIAEDLGVSSPELHKLLEDSGFPGMRVLEFAFDPNEESSYLPHALPRNCVCYVGTHDNDTALGWKEHADKKTLEKAVSYLGLHEEEGFAYGMIRGGMSSVADLFIAQMQDYLELGSKARMNTPGTMYGNWKWRIKSGEADKALAARIAKMTRLYGRSSGN